MEKDTPPSGAPSKLATPAAKTFIRRLLVLRCISNGCDPMEMDGHYGLTRDKIRRAMAQLTKMGLAVTDQAPAPSGMPSYIKHINTYRATQEGIDVMGLAAPPISAPGTLA